MFDELVNENHIIYNEIKKIKSYITEQLKEIKRLEDEKIIPNSKKANSQTKYHKE